jgi:MFS transporter, DHA2 family, multidrug resistance protein
MRLGGAEIGVGLMGTWLRVREQVDSNFLGQHAQTAVSTSRACCNSLSRALPATGPRWRQRGRSGHW